MRQFDVIMTLTPAQRERLSQADITDPDSVVQLDDSVSLDDLADADMVINARTFLNILAEAPAAATKSLGNLPRRFVERMVAEMRFPPLRLELLQYVNKRFDEDDVPELHVLRVVLGLAGLIKKRNGRFSLTKRGERLAGPQHAGELWAILVRTYFGRFNICYRWGLVDDRFIQRHIAWTLWWIRARAERPAGTADLAGVLSLDTTAWRRWSEDAYLGGVARLLLDPMRELGLLRCHRTEAPPRAELGYHWEKTCTWETTELFRRAVRFDLGPIGERGPETPAGTTRHLHLVKPTDEPDLQVDSAAHGSEAMGALGDADQVVAFRVELKGIKPAIWRHLEVRADTTFERLHMYLNTTMGWLDYHLHEFMIGPRRIGMPDDDWMAEYPCEDETSVTFADVLSGGSPGASAADSTGAGAADSTGTGTPDSTRARAAGSSGKRAGRRELLYRYDFGDGWEHRVTIEGVHAAEAGVLYPRCTAGARACPPEDCGGVHGYSELLEALADPRHPDHEDMREWSGGDDGAPYDPEAFDLESVNLLLHILASGTISDEDWDHFLPS
jgi:hypothetical protein